MPHAELVRPLRWCPSRWTPNMPWWRNARNAQLAGSRWLALTAVSRKHRSFRMALPLTWHPPRDHPRPSQSGWRWVLCICVPVSYSVSFATMMEPHKMALKRCGSGRFEQTSHLAGVGRCQVDGLKATFGVPPKHQLNALG